MNPRPMLTTTGLTADSTAPRTKIRQSAFRRIAALFPWRRLLLRAAAATSEFWLLCAMTTLFLAGASAIALRAIAAITAFH
jgi:hypothetical protein